MSMVSRILVADEDGPGQALRTILREDGYRVELTHDGEQAQRVVHTEHVDLLIADLVLPSMDGFELLTAAHESHPSLPIILISEYGTIETAVEALKRGAYHYFQKPLDFAAVRATVAEALNGHRQPKRRLPESVAPSAPRAPVGDLGIVGRGPWLEEAMTVLRQVAPTRATVLLTGASGTGKELFARALHRMSGRKGPFVAVSCAALSRDLLESELFGHEKGAFTGADRRRPGRFELADGGTLFLDEIGDVPLDLQVKLLRVLQEREFERVGGTETLRVDVRIVAATNRDLNAALRERAFREDLYYRLKVIEIQLPSLKDRLQDVETLAAHFIGTCAAANHKPVLVLGAEALDLLQRYSWPGNVRELENVIERAVVLAGKTDTMLVPSLLPASLRGESTPAHTPETIDRRTGRDQQERPDQATPGLAETGVNVTDAHETRGGRPRAVRYSAERVALWRRRRAN